MKIAIAGLSALLFSVWVRAQENLNKGADDKVNTEVKALEKRIQELQTGLENISERQSEIYKRSMDIGVRSFLSNKLSIGGFFETAMTGLTGPDTEAQFSANSNILGLNIAADVGENLKLSTQTVSVFLHRMTNLHNSPDYPGGNREFGTSVYDTQPTVAYLDYLFTPALNFQAGFSYVPFGIAYQMRDLHLFRKRGGPTLITLPRTGRVGIANTTWMGVHLYGSFPSELGRWGYNLYTFSPTANRRTIGYGSRLWLQPSEYLSVGVSGQSGKQGNDDYYSYGADIDAKFGAFGILTEYGRNVLWTGTPSPHSYYVEPYYSFAQGEWIIYLSADFYDNPNYIGMTTAGSGPDPYTVWEWGGGINWLPYPTTRLRLGFVSHDYITHTAEVNGRDKDYYSFDLSVGVAF